MFRRITAALLSLLLAAPLVAQTFDETGAQTVANSDRSASATLGALNAVVSVRVDGREGVGFFLTSANLSATLTPEFTIDTGNTNWEATSFVTQVPGSSATIAATAVFTGIAATEFREIVLPAGARQARVRISTYASGTSTGSLRATGRASSLISVPVAAGAGSSIITDGSGAGQADVIGTAPTTEQGLVVRNIPSGTQTVTGTGGTFPVTDSGGSLTVDGAVTANAGTNLNTSALALEASLVKLPVAQGSTTAGQSGPLSQGAVTTAAPTYTTAQTAPLSLTTAGELRVTGTGGGSVTQGTSPWVVGQGTAANLNATVVGTGTLAVQNTAATPAGSNNIGDVDVLTMPQVVIDDSTPVEVNCVTGCGGGSGGTSAVDNSAFTGGTTAVTPMGALLDATPPTITDGSIGAPRMDANRILMVAQPTAAQLNATVTDGTGPLTIDGTVTAAQATAANLNATVVGTGTFAVQNTAATPAGSNNIGDVDVLTLPAVTQGTAAAGTGPWPVALTEDGTNTIVKVADDANKAIRVNVVAGGGAGGGTSAADSSAFTFDTTPVTPMGAVVDDTATDTVAENAVGAPRMTTNRVLMAVDSSTVAQGSTTSGQVGQLSQAAVTTSPPSYTNGQTSPITMGLTGALRTEGTTTETNSATIATNTGNSANHLDSLTIPQGNTITSQVGPLAMGSVTTSDPSYTTAQVSPLSLNTAGALRVTSTGLAVINGLVSTGNSSTALLGSGAVFTGTGEEIKEYSSVDVLSFSDVASATNGLSIQTSTNNTDWIVYQTFTTPTAANFYQSFPTIGRYFRLVYTNSGTAQATFRLQVIYRTAAPAPRVYDLNTLNATTENVQGVVLRGSTNSNSFELGTTTNPMFASGIATTGGGDTNHMPVGGKSETVDDTAPAIVPGSDAQNVPFVLDRNGALFTHPHPPRAWHTSNEYTTQQTDVTVKAAPGASLSLFVTDISLSCNGAATITIEESTTTLKWRHYCAAAGDGKADHFIVPIKITANTLVSVTSSAAITFFLNLNGYTQP